jgi:hypothetical protein
MGGSLTRFHQGKTIRARIRPSMIPPPPTRRKSSPASHTEKRSRNYRGDRETVGD